MYFVKSRRKTSLEIAPLTHHSPVLWCQEIREIFCWHLSLLTKKLLLSLDTDQLLESNPVEMGQLTNAESLSLSAVTLASVAVLWNAIREGEPLISSVALSGIAFVFTFCLIRWLGEVFMNAGLKGKDMSKAKKIEIPETMGSICAIVYLLTLIVFIPLPFYHDIVAATSGGGNRDVMLELKQVETGRLLHKFPHSKVCNTRSASSPMPLTLPSSPFIYPVYFHCSQSSSSA